MKPREVLAIPAGLAAVGVLLLRTFLSWIFSLPKWIIQKLDALYYWFVQLGRRITGEAIWRPFDYETLRIEPPGGWSKISPEQRDSMVADGWVFIEQAPNAPPWKCATAPRIDDDEPVPGFDPDTDLPMLGSDPPSVIVNPEVLEEKEPTP